MFDSLDYYMACVKNKQMKKKPIKIAYTIRTYAHIHNIYPFIKMLLIGFFQRFQRKKNSLPVD